MPLRDADVLFGKLAIGRKALGRQDALHIARELEASATRGRRESFESAAVRLGYLENRRARELSAVLARGQLVCRGRCGARRPLAEVPPPEASTCRACGGPLYVARQVGGGGGPGRGSSFELDVPGPSADSSDPPPAGALDAGTSALAAADDARSTAPTAGASAGPPGPGESAAAPGDGAAEPSEEEAEEAGESFTFLDLDTPELGAPEAAGPPPSAAAAGERPGAPTPELTRTRAASASEAGPAEPAAPAELEPFRLAEDLEVVARVGAGGMGIVYRALALPERRPVAVKVLTARLPEVVQRFDREIRVSSQLDHPNIVKIFRTGTAGAGPEEGKPYYVMDYVAGRDLGAWLEEGPRSVEARVRVVLLLCRAVEYAHARGVVHRDIKPSNVLVRSSDDFPVLCDFGLARCRSELTNLTQTGDIVGTPAYMAPEQARSEKQRIGPPTDVWGLGGVLYHLLAGRPPFSAPTPFATIDKVIREAPAAPRTLRPEIPSGLEAVVLQALEKDPVSRFHTAQALREGLAPFAGGGA